MLHHKHCASTPQDWYLSAGRVIRGRYRPPDRYIEWIHPSRDQRQLDTACNSTKAPVVLEEACGKLYAHLPGDKT